MKYLILGDIKNSSQIDNITLHNIINHIAKNINNNFKLSVPLFVTLGDSFQLVAKNKKQANEIIKKINKLSSNKCEFRYVFSSFPVNIEHISTIKKFNNVAIKKGGAYINPLICPTMIKAYKILDQKNDGITYQ